MSQDKIIIVLRDIRFWLLIWFCLHLTGITNPPVEPSHSWRQAYTCMVARNFTLDGPDILYPKVDYMGPEREVTASEFHFFSMLISGVSKIFGYDHWFGRLINLIVTSMGIWFFYRIIRRWIAQREAFISTLVLMVSSWFMFSRKIMPDTFSVSLVIIGMYYALKYLDQGKWHQIIFGFLLLTLGTLNKIPSAILASVLLIPLLTGQFSMKRRITLVISGVFTFFIILLWYFHWVPHLITEYGNPLYFPRSFSVGLAEIMNNPWISLEKFYFSALRSYAALAFFLAGIIIVILKRQKIVLYILLITLLATLIFAIKAGIIFSTHDYYIIPFVPVMALVSGYALSRIRNRIILSLFVAVMVIEGVANQYHDFFPGDENNYYLSLESNADSFSTREDLFIVNGGLDPRLIYFLNRRGWSLDPDDVCNHSIVDSLTSRGAVFLVLEKKTLQCDSFGSLLYEDERIEYSALKVILPGHHSR